MSSWQRSYDDGSQEAPQDDGASKAVLQASAARMGPEEWSAGREALRLNWSCLMGKATLLCPGLTVNKRQSYLEDCGKL